MEHFEQIVDKKTVTFNEISGIVGNKSSAEKVVQRYLKKGFLARVKKDLYVAINLETKEPIANKFMIASKIAEDTTVCGISALEYYGYYNQVRNDCFVMSKTRFRNFEYNGIFYERMNYSFAVGINKINNFITITDLERSLVDVIKDLGKVTSLEELNNMIALIPSLNESKIKKYLDLYNIQFLYQKAGYILEKYKDELNVSDKLFKYLKTKIKTKRYLLNNESNVVYNSDWKLIVPLNESRDENAIY